jgi:chemotaxis protein MotB
MAENLLYKSGSAAVEGKGKEALKTLAKVLNDHPKVKVDVIGHTDSVMYKGAKDNWALSAERAIGVVRTLRDNGVDQTRMTACGRSKFDPVASNATAEGKAKNRRTEIILRSDYEKIWKETVLGH